MVVNGKLVHITNIKVDRQAGLVIEGQYRLGKGEGEQEVTIVLAMPEADELSRYCNFAARLAMGIDDPLTQLIRKPRRGSIEGEGSNH